MLKDAEEDWKHWEERTKGYHGNHFQTPRFFTPLFSGIKGNIGNDEADHSQETQLNAFQNVFCNQHPKTLDGMTEDKNKV